MINTEVFISRGFLDQLFTGARQRTQSASLRTLSSCLRFDSSTRLRAIKLFGWQIANVYVGFVKLLLSLIGLKRLLEPVIEPTCHPNRMLVFAEDINREWLRINPFAIGQIGLRQTIEAEPSVVRFSRASVKTLR